MAPKKRLIKRSNIKSHSDNLDNTAPSMALSPPYNLSYRRLVFGAPAFIAVCFVVFLSFSSNRPREFPVGSGISPSVYSVEVVNEFPHDPRAFTQGLLYVGNDTLFESTGLYGESSVRKVALHTGKVEVLQKMEKSFFGEGLTLLGDKLFQVTWLKNVGFIYDRNNLSNFEKFTHQMIDGWGLATDDKILFGSDGTSTLYQIDPQTYKVKDKQVVKYKGYEVHNLNELEYINGEVWANIWQTDCIARISYRDGNVIGWILLPQLREGLLAAGNHRIDVLNGIAWDGEKKRIFVTGKLWPKLYEIRLQPLRKMFGDEFLQQNCMPQPFNFGRP